MEQCTRNVYKRFYLRPRNFPRKTFTFFSVSQPTHYISISFRNAQQILFDNIFILEKRNSQSIFTLHGHCISIMNMVLIYHGTKFTEFLLINTYQWYANEGSLKSAFAHTAAIYLEVFCHKFSMFLH